MAQGRIILRTLGSSRKFADVPGIAGKLGEFTQALYPLLIANSDDFGRLPGDAFTVKHAVFPTSKRNEGDFETALVAMHKAGLILRYRIGGEWIIQIAKFDDGQSGLHKRTKSKFPAPPENISEITNVSVIPGDSGNPPELPSDNDNDNDNDTEGKGVPSPLALLNAWNETVTRLPKAHSVDGDRRTHAMARLKDEPDLEMWRAIFRRMDESAFCRGELSTGQHKHWRADFDFALRPGTRGKVLEGKYDNRTAPEWTPPKD